MTLKRMRYRSRALLLMLCSTLLASIMVLPAISFATDEVVPGELKVLGQQAALEESLLTGDTALPDASESSAQQEEASAPTKLPRLLEVTVTFNTMGGSACDPIALLEGESIDSLPVPTLDGAEFAGWYSSPLYVETTLFTEKSVVNQSVTLYAKWNYQLADDLKLITQVDIELDVPKAYQPLDATPKVSTNFNDGAIRVTQWEWWWLGDSAPFKPYPGENATAENAFQINYSFVPVEGYAFSPDLKVTINGYEPFEYAVSPVQVSGVQDWQTAREFAVLFDYGTGGPANPDAPNPAYYLEGEPYGTLPVGTHPDGFNFVGWFTSEDTILENWVSPDTVVDYDHTLYAKWEQPNIQTYTVDFETYGPEIPAVTVEPGKKLDRPADPVQDYFEFVQWYVDEEFTTPWNFNHVVPDNMTLYAKWYERYDEVEIVIDAPSVHASPTNEYFAIPKDRVFVKDAWFWTVLNPETGAFTSLGNQSFELGMTYRLNFSLNTITEKGIIADAAVIKHSDGTTAVITARPDVFSLEGYLEWKTPAAAYTVTFDTQGGSAVDALDVFEGESLASYLSSVEAPNQYGYGFGGWYTDAACTQSVNPNQLITGNMTLFAKWTPTFELSDLTIESAPVRIAFDEFKAYETEVFDVTVLLNGVKVRPYAPITFEVELSQIDYNALSVYHQRSDGSFESLPYTRTGNRVSVTSSDFSLFVFANKLAADKPAVDAGSSTVSSIDAKKTVTQTSATYWNSIPKTSDISIVLWKTIFAAAVLLITAAGSHRVLRKN